MIDWDRIAELRAEIGIADFDDIVAIFLQEVEAEIALLQKDSHTEQLESRFHLLKGSALNLGFRAFAEHCQTGEAAAAQNRPSNIDPQSTLAMYDLSKRAFMTGLRNLAADRDAAPPR